MSVDGLSKMYVKQSDCIFSWVLSISFHCISSAVYCTFCGCEGLLLPAKLTLFFSKMNLLVLLANSLQGSPISRSFIKIRAVSAGLEGGWMMFPNTHFLFELVTFIHVKIFPSLLL